MPILPPRPGPIPAQAPGGTCSFKGIDVITQAMLEAGIIDPNETVEGAEATTGLTKLNRMLDSWNADERYVYAEQFNQYRLQPNLQPHTIGPSGTFIVNQRPVKIIDANIILNAGTNNEVRSPVWIRDAEWWASKPAFNVATTLPTDLYYESDWPNGSLFLWAVPTTAYPLELVTWTLLNQLQLNSSFCLPPGYLDAVVYSLAVALCPSFGKEVSPTLAALTLKALARIEGPNLQSPRIATRDLGMPESGKQRPYFNWLTGLSTR